MSSVERLLKRIIAEAKVVGPGGIEMDVADPPAAAPREQRMQVDPFTARAVDTSLRRGSINFTTTFSRAIQSEDPVYAARSRLVSSYRAIRERHRNPVSVVDDYVNSGANLPSQRRKRVPMRVIVDILLTPDAMEDLGVNPSEVTEALNGLSVSSGESGSAKREAEALFVPVDAARRFAGEIAAATLRIGEKDAGAAFDAELVSSVDRIMEVAAQRFEGDFSLQEVIADIGTALRRKPQAIVRTRLLTEAMDLQPLLAERRASSSLVRIGYTRTSGGTRSKEVPFVDPVTGRESKTQSTTVLYRERPRDTVVATFSSKLLGTPREEITPDEAAIFDHAAAARDRFLKADGLSLVAKAHYLLSRKRDVLDNPNATIRKTDRVLLERIFDGIADAVKRHPYGSIVGIDGLVKKAEEALGKTLASAGPTAAAAAASGLPALTLTAEQAEAVKRIETDASNAAEVEAFKGAVLASLQGGAGTFDSSILGAVTAAAAQTDDSEVQDLITPLITAIDEGQSGGLLVRIADATPEVTELERAVAEDVSDMREVSDADNKALRDALNVVLNKDFAARAVKTLIRQTERETQGFFAPASPFKREGVKSQRPLTGEDAFNRLASLVQSTLEDTRKDGYERYPADIIAKALNQAEDPTSRGKTLEKILDDHVSPLRNIRKAAKEDMKSTEAEMNSILDSLGTLTDESKRLRAQLLAAARGGQKISLTRAVGDRVRSARFMSLIERAGSIILTSGNIRTGACQLVIDKRSPTTGDEDIGFDSGTPYASPYGVNSGDVSVRKNEQRSVFIERVVATRLQPEYITYLGPVMMPGSVVAVPALIGPAQRGSDLRASQLLTLGVGVVTNFVNHRYTPRMEDFTRYLGLTRAQIRDLGLREKLGMQANVAGSTVRFAQGQWRINGKAYDKALVNGAAAELSALGQELASARTEKNARRIEIAERRIEEAQGRVKAMPRVADVIAALRTGTSAEYTIDPDTVSINEQTGELTISHIAPAFLSLARDYTSELDMGGWETTRATGNAAADIPVEELQRLQTRTTQVSGVSGVKSYVPVGAMIMGADHGDDLDSPFNSNRPPGTAVTYSVGAPGGTVQSSVRIVSESRVDPAEVRRSAVADIQLALRGLVGTAVQVREVTTLQYPRETGAIQLSIRDEAKAPPESVLDAIRTVERVALSYDLDAVEPSDMMHIVLRPMDRDISGVNMSAGGFGSFEVKVGSMVYLAPMYGPIGSSASAVKGVLDEANLPSPPELYGAGRVSRIYFNKDASVTESEEFRAILVDITFRGDQVKEGGTRGSILDPAQVVRGVGVAFVRPLPEAFSVMSPAVRRVGDMAANYPKRSEGGGFQEQGVSTHPLRLTGWTHSSPADTRRGRRASLGSTAAGGRLRIGSRVRIVQTTHPEAGATGILRGFRTRDRIDPLQERILANSRIPLGEVNAIIQIDGGNIVADFSELLTRARKDLVGPAVPKSSILPIFRHIDADITQRYLKNPKGAMGYIAAEVGYWDASAPGSEARAVMSGDTVTTQRVQQADGRVVVSPVHGAGSWDAMHKQGVAVHPADPQFATRAGYRRGIEHKIPGLPSGVRLDTVNGCVAIAEAIMEHGPEREFTNEQVHEAEVRRFGTGESFGIAGTSDLALRDPYPMGTHTEEAKYFQHSKPVWMDVAMKSGRGTGATAKFLPKLIRRVGSPVGTSFRFQLSEESGLEYTRILRQNMQTVGERAEGYLTLMEDMLSRAKGDTINQSRAVALCEKMRDEYKAHVLGAINLGISRVNTLGYSDESGRRRRNSAEAYKDALNKFSDWRQTTTQEYDVDGVILERLRGTLQRIDQIFNPRVEGGERNIPGGAPVPTAYTLARTSAEGDEVPAYTLQLRDPQPVDSAIADWAGVYRQAAYEIAKLEGSRIAMLRAPAPKAAPTEQVIVTQQTAQSGPRRQALVNYIMSELEISLDRVGIDPSELGGASTFTLDDGAVALAVLTTAALDRDMRRVRGLSPEDAVEELRRAVEEIALSMASGDKGAIAPDLSRIQGVITDAATPQSAREMGRLAREAQEERRTQGAGASTRSTFAGMTPEASQATAQIERRFSEIARTVSDQAIPQSEVSTTGQWVDMISTLPTLGEALQTAVGLGVSEMVSVIKMGETQQERVRTFIAAPHIDLSIDTSQLESARRAFVSDMDSASSSLSAELKEVAAEIRQSDTPYMRRLVGLVDEVTTVLDDLMGLLRGASAPDYVIPSRSHLANSRNYNYARSMSKYVGITSVNQDTGDLVARRAADIVTNILIALEPIAAIVFTGKVVARVAGTEVPGGSRSDLEAESKAREALENIRTSHERDQFRSIPGFPNSDAYMDDRLGNMIQATMSLAMDDVVVPIVVPDVMVPEPGDGVVPDDTRELAERAVDARRARDESIRALTSLTNGRDVPEDAQPLVAAALEQVS